MNWAVQKSRSRPFGRLNLGQGTEHIYGAGGSGSGWGSTIFNKKLLSFDRNIFPKQVQENVCEKSV
jgi:hypothetical protein